VYIFVVLVTILVALLLMVVILMQASKGGGLSATFGGGGGDTMLSTRQAATVLHKVTIYLVGSFMFLCLLATMLSGRGTGEAQSVTTNLLEQQSASSGFNPSIPVLPPDSPTGSGTGDGEGK
jgi:preprotein translocase subunit SecG